MLTRSFILYFEFPYLTFGIGIRILILEVYSMPKKTIYIRLGDIELWEKAEKLAGESLSALLIEALRQYVEKRERELKAREERQTEMENVTLEITPVDGATGFVLSNRAYKVQFTGTLLGSTSGIPRYDVYLTKGGKLIVYYTATDIAGYEEFDTLEDLANEYADKLGDDIMTEIADALGEEYVVKIE